MDSQKHLRRRTRYAGSLSTDFMAKGLAKGWVNVIDVLVFWNWWKGSSIVLKVYNIIIIPRISCSRQVYLCHARKLALIFVDVCDGRTMFQALGFPMLAVGESARPVLSSPTPLPLLYSATRHSQPPHVFRNRIDSTKSYTLKTSLTLVATSLHWWIPTNPSFTGSLCYSCYSTVRSSTL